MRTAAVLAVLLAPVAAVEAQKNLTPASTSKPINIPATIKIALEHTPEDLAFLAETALTAPQAENLDAVVTALEDGELFQAQTTWTRLVESLMGQAKAEGANAQFIETLQRTEFAAGDGARSNLASGDVALIEAAFGTPADLVGSSIDAVVQMALSGAYVPRNADLLDYATGVAERGQPIYELLRRARTIRAQLHPDDYHASWKIVRAKESAFLASLGLPDQVPPAGCETPEELDALLEAWDEELQTVGDDAQLANVDMQNMLQKQQQTMQMMSQISKMLHDTAMAAIRKMAG